MEHDKQVRGHLCAKDQRILKEDLSIDESFLKFSRCRGVFYRRSSRIFFLQKSSPGLLRDKTFKGLTQTRIVFYGKRIFKGPPQRERSMPSIKLNAFYGEKKHQGLKKKKTFEEYGRDFYRKKTFRCLLRSEENFLLQRENLSRSSPSIDRRLFYGKRTFQFFLYK